MIFAVEDGACNAEFAHAAIIKDAGDDPDCTHGAHLTVDVRKLPEQSGTVEVMGGSGVGTITMAGLGLEVGEIAR